MKRRCEQCKHYDKCFKEEKLDKPKGVPYEYK